MSPVFYEQRGDLGFVMNIGAICDHPFPSHVHDPVEIVCPTGGYLDMTIAGKGFRVGPGDIAIAFPSIPHSYDFVSEDIQGVSLIFSPDTIAEFSRTFRSMVPASPLLSSADKNDDLNVIVRNLVKLSTQENSPLKLGYLHLFLSYLFSCVNLQPIDKHVLTGMTYQVLHYISEHFTEPLSLESTAHALGISQIHLSHIFSQQLHINFRQYINTLRIDRACSLLRDPAYSISQVVYLCGYGNPRTFHRAFLAQCGMPPNQYRARMTGLPEEAEDSTN